MDNRRQYNIQLLQEPNEDVLDQRLQFFLNGIDNQDNFRYWNVSSPRILLDVQTRKPNDGLIFLEIILLVLFIFLKFESSSLTIVIENNPAYNEGKLMFQQDGAPPRYSGNVHETISGLWIGRKFKLLVPLMNHLFTVVNNL